MPDPTFDAAPEAGRARLVHGGDAPPPERLAVRAGPLSLVIEAGDVRHVHVGPREVVRRIYGAVRDHAWRTIPAQLSGFTLERGAATFRCRYHAEHQQDAVAFGWDATIEGVADGTLTFAFDGVAESTFDRNRIGLCLLHPLPELSGAGVRVTTTEGGHQLLRFPDLVAVDQPVPGFRDIAALACEIAPDVWLEASFEGDVFETEDQRNWIDASSKTYGTPLALPKPVTVARGTRVRQQITLRLRNGRGEATSVVAAPFVIDAPSGELRFGDGLVGRLPAIGLRVDGRDELARAAAAIARLRPAHLRVDLDLATESHAASLSQVRRLAAALAAATANPDGATTLPPLEVALHLPDDAAAATRALDTVPAFDAPLARLLAFTAGHDSTQASSVAALRAWRARACGTPWPPIASGTTGDLYRIHLARPAAGEAVCWSMHPQAHATDLTSIAETPAGAHDQVVSVRHRCPGLGTAIALTFARPPAIDPRARSLFAAGWTLAVLAALGRAGADSVTLADTDPAALADGRVPLAHLLAALAAWRGAQVRAVHTTLRTVHALALEAADGRTTLFVANLAPRPCDLALPDPTRIWRARLLDADRELGDSDAPPLALTGDESTLLTGRVHLGPCAIARLDGGSR